MSDNSIVPLTFPGSGQRINIVEIDGEPWFVAADICREIGLSKVSQAVNQLVVAGAFTKVPHNVQTPTGGTYQTDILIVDEAGMYEMVISSRKPGAKIFRKWIFNEVIPTIRRTGFYQTAEHRESQVMELAEKMDPSYRTIDKAWRNGEIPSNVIRAFAHNHGLLTEAVGFPQVMTTSGEIDDSNGVGKNRTARLNNGTTRSRMYERKFGRKPFKAVTWRANEFRIVNQFPKNQAKAIEGFRDKQPKALDK